MHITSLGTQKVPSSEGCLEAISPPPVHVDKGTFLSIVTIEDRAAHSENTLTVVSLSLLSGPGHAPPRKWCT